MKSNSDTIFDFEKEFKSMMEKHDLNTVVLLGHKNPDGDAAGSVMGLAHYLKYTFPQYKVYPYLSDLLDKGPKQFVKEDPVFDPFLPPKAEHYGVIVCDTPTIERMYGEEYYNDAAFSIVIDHHLSNQGYGDVNYTVISEACAQNIFLLLDGEKLKEAVEKEEAKQKEEHLRRRKPEDTFRRVTAAEFLYLGMAHDTGGYARADKYTMHAASSLIQMGVNHRRIVKTLHTLTLKDLQKRSVILGRTEKFMGGQVAYIVIPYEEAMIRQISYEDIHPISGILRDCEDIELGFTMYEEAPGKWRFSFRSDGVWINTNELVGHFGGGGHSAAAGLRKASDHPEELLHSVLRRIMDMKQEEERKKYEQRNRL